MAARQAVQSLSPLYLSALPSRMMHCCPRTKLLGSTLVCRRLFVYSYHSLVCKEQCTCTKPAMPAALIDVTPTWRWYSNGLRESSSGSHERMMPFEDYRKLKKSLKLRARVAGIPAGFVGVMVSSFLNVHFNPSMLAATEEEIKPILGMDPMAFALLCGAGSGLVAFMLGGAFFKAFWRIMFPSRAKQIAVRDEDFLARLQRYRFSAVSTYDDDFYGDKVMTLSDYRQWIRQQQQKRNKANLSDTQAQTDSPTNTP